MRQFMTLLFLILATGFCRVAGQDFVLPRHVVATDQELKTIHSYYDKAPLLEKFYILTSIPHAIHCADCQVWERDRSAYEFVTDLYIEILNYGGKSTDEDLMNATPYGDMVDKQLYDTLGYNARAIIEAISDLRQHHAGCADFNHRYAPYHQGQYDTIDYENGYMSVNCRDLAYWRYDKYIIATNAYVNELEHTSDGYPLYKCVPAFFKYDGQRFKQVYMREVVKSLGVPVMKWYDLITFEEYYMLDKYLSRDFDINFNYKLPQQGKDILVDIPYTSKPARYVWNGDGTFTKIGRSDHIIREIKDNTI